MRQRTKGNVYRRRNVIKPSEEVQARRDACAIKKIKPINDAIDTFFLERGQSVPPVGGTFGSAAVHIAEVGSQQPGKRWISRLKR